MPYIGNQAVVGDSANTFKLLDDIASFTVTFDATDSGVVSIANNTLTFSNHRFVTAQKVTYNDGGGTAIGGLSDGSYFIIKVDQNTIKLASSASNAASGTAIDLTSGAAGGSHTLKIAFDGINTKFKATHTNGTKAKISRAAQLSLSINGVIQQPQDTTSPTVGYGIESDSTIVFSTAPAATDKVFGSFIGEVAASFDIEDNTIDNFTGDGSTTIFNLSKEVPSSQDVLVTLDGVTQHPSDGSTTRSYSVIDQALTFVSAPDTGVAIQARHIGFAGATTSAVTGFYGRTGNAALISTDDISVQNISAGIATFNTIAVGGTVSIGGTLTYEDVTNIDSVGLVTARNGIVVGSGITLSKDGDVFFTGIATGNGSGLTALNATQLTSGTVPTARLGSGTASSSTFLRGDSSFQTVNTDLVSDTSPQLGGDLDTNSFEISLDDNHAVKFGDSADLTISHSGTEGSIDCNTGDLQIKLNDRLEILPDDGTSVSARFTTNEVQLMHNNSEKTRTTSTGLKITGKLTFAADNHLNGIELGADQDINLYHDGSDAYFDNSTGDFYVRNAGDNSNQVYIQGKGGENGIIVNGDGSIDLYHDNALRAYTTSNGLKVETTSSDNARVEFKTSGHNYSQVGYFGLNRFGIDTHDGLEVRDASDSYATRMKIDANGRFNVNAGGSLALQTAHHCIQNSNATSWAMQAVNTASNGYGVEIRVNSDTASREALYIYSTSASAAKASILSNGTFNSATNNYGSLSDAKLKENIVDANSQWDDLKAVKVRNFNFISDASNTKLLGVVAQELETVCPSLIENISDKEINGEGERVETGTSTKNVKYSVLYMKAIKTLQEAQTRIETLESEVAALKSS